MTPETRTAQAARLHAAGVSYGEIARRFGVRKSTVARLIQYARDQEVAEERGVSVRRVREERRAEG